MRTLERNKVKLWVVTKIGKTDVLDDEGYFTGEQRDTYSNPVAVMLNLFPANGELTEKLFGNDISVDMVTVTDSKFLNKNSLLFIEYPLSNYDTTYDYSIEAILESLNTVQYGLRRSI